MNDSNTQTEPVKEIAPKPISRWVYVERGFSLAAILGVILLGGSAIQGMQNLFSDSVIPVTAEDLRSRQSELPLPPSALSAMNRSGHWQMAGWQWELGTVTVEEQEVDQYLANVPSAADMFSLEERERAARLIEAMEYLPFEKIDRSSDTLYRLEQKQFKLNVVTAMTDGVALPVSVAAATKVNDREWTVFEMRAKQPATSTAQQSISIVPKDSQVLCSRTDPQGRVLFQIIQTDTEISKLVDQLGDQGWQVRTAPNTGQPNQGYLLANQDELFHVWNVSSKPNAGHQLALMCVSDPNHQTTRQD